MTELEYINYIDYKKIEINNLPSNIKISTMSASCKLNTEINIVNIEKYLDLNINDVVRIYKKRHEIIKSLIPIEKKNKRNIAKSTNNVANKHFYNQITVVIRIGSGNEPITDWKKEPKINLKLFTNGSIQMSGCKTVEGINIVLNKLLYRLKEEKAKINKISQLVEETPFISKPQNVTINDFQIYMINANYQVKMQIDRAKLLNLLLKKKIKAYFEPCIRACVVVKFIPPENNIEEKEISIFIFQKGNIIITGARTRQHIISAYQYILNILVNHHNEIYKKDELEEENIIFETCNNIFKDVELGLINFN
jgi:TATA-box binding protein (TBP) (component of TFIID and TFIIIB)